nr:hypothetical protein [uncultured Flavobacterium sp.]
MYGMLGIGLILFTLRNMYRIQKWNDKLIGFAFWSINIGLMLVLSLLPMVILQAVASINKGMWYARSAEFLKGPGMDNIK